MITVLLLAAGGWMWWQGATAPTLVFAALLIVRSELGAWCHTKADRKVEAVSASLSQVVKATADAFEAQSLAAARANRDVLQFVLDHGRGPKQTH